MALIKPLATLRKAEEGGQKAKGFVQMGIQATLNFGLDTLTP
jgi:hypothetical protein